MLNAFIAHPSANLSAASARKCANEIWSKFNYFTFQSREVNSTIYLKIRHLQLRTIGEFKLTRRGAAYNCVGKFVYGAGKMIDES